MAWGEAVYGGRTIVDMRGKRENLVIGNDIAFYQHGDSPTSRENYCPKNELDSIF